MPAAPRRPLIARAAVASATAAGGVVAWRRAAEARAEAARASERLERSNRDLEQFASVASHDLQEPLRTVDGFLGLLQRRHAAQLPVEAQELIVHALTGTRRMQQLIDDLLAYARAGSEELGQGPVDLDAVVRAALADLDAQVSAAGAVVEIGALPVVQGDARQLAQLVQNLLTNALKFVDAGPPRVRVDARRTGSDWEVSVQDNGVGIDPAQAPEAFEMFRRLPGGRAREGTGVGLAICLRVVERHGGRIWVDPAPGGGSSFRFTLPG